MIESKNAPLVEKVVIVAYGKSLPNHAFRLVSGQIPREMLSEYGIALHTIRDKWMYIYPGEKTYRLRRQGVSHDSSIIPPVVFERHKSPIIQLRTPQGPLEQYIPPVDEVIAINGTKYDPNFNSTGIEFDLTSVLPIMEPYGAVKVEQSPLQQVLQDEELMSKLGARFRR